MDVDAISEWVTSLLIMRRKIQGEEWSVELEIGSSYRGDKAGPDQWSDIGHAARMLLELQVPRPGMTGALRNREPLRG
jgi:hypothetical protein